MQSDIQSLLARHAESGFSGVALVTRGNDVLVHAAYGLAHRGFRVPNRTDTRFDIASVTKIFTAASTMQLVDRSEIALDTRVMPFIGVEGTKISDDVTVYHCLTHTSGIADDADEEAGEHYELLFVDKPNYSIRETKDFLPQFAYKDPVFAPGAGVRYNNVAWVLLGLVIEKATGKTYRDYVREHVFARAGMIGADFCAMDGVCENLAEHYRKIEHDDGTVEWRTNIYSYPPIGSPDGGATVTAMDLDRFFRAVRDGALMGEGASRQLMTPRVKRKDTDSGSLWNGFALEFTLDANGEIVHLGKDGINAGVCSLARYYPTLDMSVVTLTNIEYDVWELQDEIREVIVAG